MAIRVGTAGWAIPREFADSFAAEGSSLERYAGLLSAAEINSSFHRPHRETTWQRWHDSVPECFRFSVKLPKLITHQHKLVDCTDAVAEFLDQVAPLGSKLAVLLVQLPPKLAFDSSIADAFFAELRNRTAAFIACEPRHLSWFTAEANALLVDREVSRVAADPALCEEARRPGGWPSLRYWRLHGSPVTYRSAYGKQVDDYAAALKAGTAEQCETWCIFDNTASSAAIGDALRLLEALRG